MARIKVGLNAKKKHNRVLKLAKGYRGARSKQYRVAKQSVMRALTSSYKSNDTCGIYHKTNQQCCHHKIYLTISVQVSA